MSQSLVNTDETTSVPARQPTLDEQHRVTELHVTAVERLLTSAVRANHSYEATTMPYANSDGVRIYYEVEGEGPPLVLCTRLALGYIRGIFWAT